MPRKTYAERVYYAKPKSPKKRRRWLIKRLHRWCEDPSDWRHHFIRNKNAEQIEDMLMRKVRGEL